MASAVATTEEHPSYEDSLYSTTTSSGVLEGDSGPHLEAIIIPSIMSVILLIGLVGNSIVIYVILKAGKGRVKSATNCYIVNLAVTDVCFLLCCVPWTSVLFIVNEWRFGRFMCRFVFYMMHVTAQATCLTLTAMSVDRYKAIVRPLRSMQNRSAREVSIIIAIIWFFSFITGVPVFVYYDTGTHVFYGPEVTICQEMWPLEAIMAVYGFYCVVMMYLGPLVVISICYLAVLNKVWEQVMPDGGNSQCSKDVRQKRHVTWMVLVVVLVFAFCWLPLYVSNTWMRVAGENFPTTLWTYIFKVVGLILAYSNSCLNPFIYAFLGQNFRRHFRRACPLCCKEPSHIYGVGVSRRTGTSTSGEEHQMVEMRRGPRYSMTTNYTDIHRPSDGSVETF